MKKLFLNLMIISLPSTMAAGPVFSKVVTVLGGGQQEAQLELSMPRGQELTGDEQQRKQEMDQLYAEYLKANPRQLVPFEKLKKEMEWKRLFDKFKDYRTALGATAGVVGVQAVLIIFNREMGGRFAEHRQDFINALANLSTAYVLNRFVSRPLLGDQETKSYLMPPSEKDAMSFDDIAGDLPPEIYMIINMSKYGHFFDTVLGTKPPRGILFYGPPGTGKTLIAKAIANLVDAAFFYIAPTDIFSKYYGDSAKQVAAIFDEARSYAKRGVFAIIFFDEIEALGSRGTNDGNTSQESNKVINQFLQEMDGFKSSDNILVIGATNMKDKLDPALLRGKRFDYAIEIPMSNESKRKAVLELHARKLQALKSIEEDIDFDALARDTDQLSNADLQTIIETSRRIATSELYIKVGMAHLQRAVQQVKLQCGAGPLALQDVD